MSSGCIVDGVGVFQFCLSETDEESVVLFEKSVCVVVIGGLCGILVHGLGMSGKCTFVIEPRLECIHAVVSLLVARS